MLKKLFTLKIFTFLPLLFGYVEERLYKNTKINFKICIIADWITNNYNTSILFIISKSKANQAIKFGLGFH